MSNIHLQYSSLWGSLAEKGLRDKIFSVLLCLVILHWSVVSVILSFNTHYSIASNFFLPKKFVDLSMRRQKSVTNDLWIKFSWISYLKIFSPRNLKISFRLQISLNWLNYGKRRKKISCFLFGLSVFVEKHWKFFDVLSVKQFSKQRKKKISSSFPFRKPYNFNTKRVEKKK